MTHASGVAAWIVSAIAAAASAGIWSTDGVSLTLAWVALRP